MKLTDLKAIAQKAKTCTVCGIDKELTEFYSIKRKTKKGYRSECKRCSSNGMSQYYRTEKYRSSRRNRCNQARLDPEKRPSILLREQKNRKNMWVKYREKERARAKLSQKIRSGKIKPKTNCEQCGEAGKKTLDGRRYIQAHHHKGYENPLDVVWLCATCHIYTHKQLTKFEKEFGG